MPMDRNRSSYRNSPFLETCPLGSGRWGHCDIPDFAISAYFHRRMRSGKADARFDNAREFEFLIEVPSPTVMRRSWKC